MEKGATNGRTKKRKAKRKRVFNVRIAQSQLPRSSLKSGDEGGKRKPDGSAAGEDKKADKLHVQFQEAPSCSVSGPSPQPSESPLLPSPSAF